MTTKEDKKTIADAQKELKRLSNEIDIIVEEAHAKIKELKKERARQIGIISNMNNSKKKDTLVAFRCSTKQDKFLLTYGALHNLTKSQAIVKAVADLEEKHKKDLE
jgi:hypothetical protein